jgi:predicted DsbA family dithiol-disulfide isomerase
MAQTRKIEIFSAGCAVCDATVQMIQDMACPSCDISVLDMKDATVAARANQVGINSVPAVLIDGQLAECCSGRGPDEASLRSAGIGQPLP